MILKFIIAMGIAGVLKGRSRQFKTYGRESLNSVTMWVQIEQNRTLGASCVRFGPLTGIYNTVESSYTGVYA